MLVEDRLKLIANSTTSTSNDDALVTSLLIKLGFRDAMVVSGIVYLGFMGYPPESIHTVARELLNYKPLTNKRR